MAPAAHRELRRAGEASSKREVTAIARAISCESDFTGKLAGKSGLNSNYEFADGAPPRGFYRGEAHFPPKNFFSPQGANTIGCFGDSDDVIIARSAIERLFQLGAGVAAEGVCSSATASVFSPSASSRLASPWLSAATRAVAQTRTIYTDTSIARGLFNTEAAMIASCSVKTRGRWCRPPRPAGAF